jgi:amino acid adenylation domain-containing protein
MKQGSIHTLFKEAVQRYGAKTAVEDASGKLTYEQLNQRAEETAHALIQTGMPSRSVVGIFLDPSIEYVIAILGCLKGGMVFMPLNTEFPAKRLTSILEKTNPGIIVTDNSREEQLCGKLEDAGGLGSSKPVFVLQDGSGVLSKSPRTAEVPRSGKDVYSTDAYLDQDSEDACYILTTSGSTGEPKAILGSHRGLTHFIDWEIREFGFNENARVSQLSPVSFDVSLRDIFVPLVVGGTVCIPDKEAAQNPSYLLKWMTDREVTITHIVPTLFRLLTRAIIEDGSNMAALPKLRYVLIAGEPLYSGDVRTWRETVGSRIELVNLYGPSETTLAKLFFRIDDVGSELRETVPIGRPIPDAEVLVIKENRSCPVGEPGEIYIRTPFMSKGYYRDKELTKKYFVQNPLLQNKMDIVYKTGDLGKFMDNDAVQFLGRIDGQLKLYGRRIEIGEIEVVLRQHRDVCQAAVKAVEDNSGNPRLVGYVVPEPGRTLTVENLHRFLGERLPDYMVPPVFVTMEALPITHNGKVDRNSLPKPGRERPEMEQPYIAPCNTLETDLCQIWAEVLGLDRVGTHDNFFNLGGTSILGVRLVEVIKKRLQVDVPIVKLFQYPNVKLLAEYLGTVETSEPSYEKVEERAQRRRAVFSSRKR